jgi:hypothetical protein
MCSEPAKYTFIFADHPNIISTLKSDSISSSTYVATNVEAMPDTFKMA